MSRNVEEIMLEDLFNSRACDRMFISEAMRRGLVSSCSDGVRCLRKLKRKTGDNDIVKMSHKVYKERISKEKEAQVDEDDDMIDEEIFFKEDELDILENKIVNKNKRFRVYSF